MGIAARGLETLEVQRIRGLLKLLRVGGGGEISLLSAPIAPDLSAVFLPLLRPGP